MIPDACHFSDHLERNVLAGHGVPSEINKSRGAFAEKLEQLKVPDIHDARLGER